MKKFVLMTFFAAISAMSFAQITWNAKAGINVSNISFDKGENPDAGIGWQVGVGMDYAFNENWSLQPSLMLIEKGAKDFSPTYLEIPVMAAYKFTLTDDMRLGISAGPYFAFGLFGSADEIDAFGSEDDMYSGEAVTKTRFDFGLGVGVTLELNRFLIGINGEWGLINNKCLGISYDSPDDWGIFENKYKNATYTLSVGYCF